MGLDMYLRKKKYIGANWEHNEVKGKIEIIQRDKLVPINFNKVVYIEEEVAYWRKANAIHKWFVDNVQEGVDDCRDYYVSFEKLKELLELCKKIDKEPSLAEELLPTQSGFFFGSTEYDEWYYNNIRDTIKMLENAITEEEKENNMGTYSDFYYYASW